MEQVLARYWEKKGEVITCTLCPRHCKIRSGGKGVCGVRTHEGGKLYTQVYEKVSAVHVDPIEKKPLYHFFPGCEVLSFGTVGCNLFCKHCQNADIAQTFTGYGQQCRVLDIVNHPSQIIAATYNEPTVFYEFMYDVFSKAKDAGKKTVMVSNGFIEEAPLRDLIPLLDAANIDLKGVDSFYAAQCSGKIDPVKRTIQVLHDAGVWVEVTFLLIHTLNDDSKEMETLFLWLATNISKDVPLHISAFYPMHKTLSIPATSKQMLVRAHDLARDCGLRYVYVGNAIDKRMHTYCPSCHALLIKRDRARITPHSFSGTCHACGQLLPGIWK